MGKIIFFIKRFLVFLVRVFFLQLENGQNCVVCGKRTFYLPVCGKCKEEKFCAERIFEIARCRICGKELISTVGDCLQCREKPVLLHVDFALSMFSYRLWNKQLMFLWKKKEVRSLSKFFAEKFCFVLKKLGINVIVPVPPRPGKILENGWDQINDVCCYLRFCFDFKIFDVLKRVSVEEQKSLTREGRLESIGKAYHLCNQKKINAVLKKFDGIVPGEVCIIDDVSTTGATLESCALLLKEIGVKKVTALTLFNVD